MKKLIKIVFFLFIPLCASGQMTPVTNHYILNPLTINPAFAGNRGVFNIAAFYRKQWVGINGAPETASLALDAPLLDDKLGLGLIITHDKMGVTRETQFNTNYAYKLNLGGGLLSFGLGAGLLVTNTAWSDLVVVDQGDEYYLIDSKTYIVPDFSFGTYYSNKNYFAGVSIPRLLGHKFNFDKNKYILKSNFDDYSFLINTGYVFNLSSKVQFFPSTLVAVSPGDKVLYDLNAHFRFIDRLWLGASYRNDRSVVGMFQFQLTNQLRFAYSYDFDFNELKTYNSGSHEVMLRYEFRYRVDAVSPLNF